MENGTMLTRLSDAGFRMTLLRGESSSLGNKCSSATTDALIAEDASLDMELQVRLSYVLGVPFNFDYLTCGFRDATRLWICGNAPTTMALFRGPD